MCGVRFQFLIPSKFEFVLEKDQQRVWTIRQFSLQDSILKITIQRSFSGNAEMGGVNSIPVVSQVKSGVQLLAGDTEGAGQTQKDFLQQCPVVSQVGN